MLADTTTPVQSRVAECRVFGRAAGVSLVGLAFGPWICCFGVPRTPMLPTSLVCGCDRMPQRCRWSDVGTDAAVRRWFSDVVVPQQETWVAVADGVVRGLLVLDAGELEQLYLEPSWRGSGLEDRFVDLAKRLRPNGLGLWTFQVNEPARRFYERHGFVEVDRTDGSRNEEREPDIRFVWRP
ncbi:GNAT family N-acetyltransferase [Nocardia sp. NPDC059246]|uniref:GNAT family N-acetyltransferase n=1 Tax=unclassified Nocardia TaxID=2637762 RepID=UPI00368B59BE